MAATVTVSEELIDRSKRNATQRGTSNITLVWTADTESDEIDIEGYVGVGFQMPSGIAATTFTFQARDPADNWINIQDSSLVDISIGATTGGFYIWMDDLLPFHKIRIVSSAPITATSYLDLKA